MKITTDGIVIRERIVKESDKVITVLTRDNGVVSAYAAGAKNIKNPKSTATGLLTYSQFVFYKRNERFTVDEAHAKEIFIELRSDLEKLALAQYFCELVGELVSEGGFSEEPLRLTLNSLYLLCKDKRPPALVKAAYELRLMSLCGFVPNLICCSGCAAYEHPAMSFIPADGELLCGDCAGVAKNHRIVTGLGVTTAMRHCIYSEFDKLFSFSLSERSLPILEKAAEEYVICQLDRNFKTLEFYKTIRGGVSQ